MNTARKHNSNKGNYGYVGIMGGCIEYSGAVKLANLGASALRAGCGVVKLIVAGSLAPAIAPYMLESTLYPMPDKNGYMVFSKEAMDRALTGLSALSVGMGWSVTSETKKILEYILAEKSLPLIIDADGINTLAQMDKSLLQRTRCRVILTPHPKEFERITGIPVKEILANPIKHAEDFAREYGVILLLKGASTVITDGEKTYITDRGCAGMATAGSGDVLSGLLTGLLGYMEYSPLTVALGAYMAGAAGEYAECENTAFGMTSGDTACMLPRVWRDMIDGA
jgi:NAD(P)H-hydrate epimerase